MKTAPHRAFQKVAVCLCLLTFPGSFHNGRLFAQSAPPAPAEPAPIQKELPPVGVPTEVVISPGQSHVYKANLPAGQAFSVTFRRMGFLFSPRIHDSKGEPLIEANANNGLNGKIQLVFIPEETGEYQLQIEGDGESGPAKAYLMTVEAQREPTPLDRAVMTLCRGRMLKEMEKYSDADGVLRQAVGRLKALGDTELLAEALLSYGFVQLNLGKIQLGQELMVEALPLFRKHGIQEGALTCLNNLAAIFAFQKNYQKAIDLMTEVIGIQRKFEKPTTNLGLSLSNLGFFNAQVGDFRKSIELQTEALELFQRLGDRVNTAATFSNLGDNYRLVGELEKSIEVLQRALKEFQALKLRRNEANTLTKLGAAHSTKGEFDLALTRTREALAIWKELGIRSSEATALNNIGKILETRREFPAAIESYRQALEISRTLEVRVDEVYFLTNLATAESKNGNLDDALKHIEEAIGIVEGVRSGLSDTGNRASFTGESQSTYQRYWEIFMTLDRARPNQGYATKALQASERSRALTLVEMLNSRNVQIREGVDAALLERQTQARKTLDAKSQALAKGNKDPAKVKALQIEVEAALAEYQLATRKLDEASPRFAGLARPAALSLDDIRKLLDPDSILLEYSFGSDQSFVWMVTPTGLKVYDLPKRSEVESLSRRTYEALSARGKSVKFEKPEERAERIAAADRAYAETSVELGKMLLGPVAGELKGKRVIVVGDGALLYLPFAVLPLPGSNQPLVTHCEVTQLPSIATLATIRRDTAGRPLASKTVAVLADPVFGANDPRLKSGKSVTPAEPTDAQRSVADIDGPDRERPLARLPFTRKEAEAIGALVPEAKRRVELDFAANRQTVTTEDLSQYRFVHFATHGLVNNVQPDLSGVVLSMVNERGEPVDGFLHAYEVFNLKLPVEMVVLSGCRTGLGKEIRGEGMIGLTRAFMYAGASRVMVSLWSVQDESTSVLMADVYRGMLGPKKLRPSAALREAQLKMMKNPRWASPYYWAAFTIQGEPR